MQSIIEAIQQLFTVNLYDVALRSSIMFPQRKNLNGGKDKPLISVEVTAFTESEMIQALKSNEQGLVELHSRDMRKGIAEIISHIPKVERELLQSIPEIHINKSGIDILRISIKDKVITEDTRVGFIELNSYKEDLLKRTSSRRKTYAITMAFVYVMVASWELWGYLKREDERMAWAERKMMEAMILKQRTDLEEIKMDIGELKKNETPKSQGNSETK